MSRPFEVHLPLELAYRRHVLFAVELLDAATLERVSRGIEVVAEGLRRKPLLNSGGFFVWLDEDFARLQKVVVKPGVRPYEGVELPASEVQKPLTKIELPPRADYPFPTGVTVLRGRLIERRIDQPEQEPVRDAKVRLRWRDGDGIWHDAATASPTDKKSGDFVSVLRLAPNEQPGIDDSGRITVRLRVSREGFNDRSSSDFQLLAGRITDPTTETPLVFAWDELMP